MPDQKLSRRNRYAWLALAMIGLSFATWRTGASTFHLSIAPKLITAADLNMQTGVVADARPAIPKSLPSFMQQSAGCGASFAQAPGSPVGVGIYPRSLAVGDFNSDGKLDLVTVNEDSNNLTILIGNGNGSFIQASGSPVLVGIRPVSVAVADTNLDGKLDLVIANFLSNEVMVLLGIGNGGFTQAAGSPISFSGLPIFVVAGDFNLDGKPDLAVANFIAASVTILLGNGNGSFTPAAGAPLNVGNTPVALAISDFNKDGKPDLAVANVGTNASTNRVTILIGDGSGGFTQATGSPISVGNGPRFISVGDFNSDGNADLAVAISGFGTVRILLGDGSGGFTQTAGSPVNVGGVPISIAVMDYNLDGKSDLAVANSSSDNIAILLGDGNVGFTQPAGSPISVGDTPAYIVAADFNLDGKPDFAVANANSNNVTIQLNTCPAQPCSGVAFQPIDLSAEVVGLAYPNFIAEGDFNLDGKTDLAVMESATGVVKIFLGVGNGNFTLAIGPRLHSTDFSRSIIAQDFNLDGKLDLVIVGNGPLRLIVYLGNGAGGFTQPPLIPAITPNFPNYAAAGDFNLDGKPDLVITSQSPEQISILLGDGTGNFTLATGSPINAGTYVSFVAVTDFNRDGKPDLAITADLSNDVEILLGDGTGAFAPASGSPVSVGTKPKSLITGDFNSDGKVDLAVANFDSNNVTILIGNGNGGLTQAVGSPINVGTTPSSIEAGDFNLDGKLDLAVANYISNNVTVLLGNGSSGFANAAGSPISVGIKPPFIVVADFNLDGKPDFATPNAGSSNVSVQLNSCTPFVPPTINCPLNIIVGNTGDQKSASVPFNVTATGIPTPTVTCRVGNTVIISPHVFPIGTTTVNCTALNGVAPDASCGFNVTVNRVSGSVNDPLVCMGSGHKVQATLNISNNGQANQNVISNTTFTNLTGVPGSCVATPNIGTCTVTASGVSYSGTLPQGTTVALTYLTQVSDLVSPGSQVCTNNSVSFNGGQPTTFSVCDVVDCPPTGPGGVLPAAAEASDQKAGSILIYNVYTSSTDPTRQNTRINLTNSHPQLPTFVHLFFVAEGCAVADSYVCLTANQTASFLASDLDPGTSGYLIAVAVDALGCPTAFNNLIGDEYVKFTSGHAANLGAEAFVALPGGLPACDQNSSIATINFDGLSYNRAPASLALNSIGSKADGNDTLLIINRIGGNLGLGASTLGTLFGILYDDSENAVSFSITGNCQLRNLLSNSFPRSTPRFETFIPAGRTGWLKVFNQTGAIGITGAAINFNPNAASSAGAFNQGHNLHHLTLNNQMSYLIPVFPPSC